MDGNWRPLVGYEECYAISDEGLCARTATYGRHPKPKWKLLAKRIKKKSGYLTFHLCKDGKRVDALAHIMVWETFRGPVPPGLELNHKNSIRCDPRLDNLELMTRSENAAYAFTSNNRPAPNNPSPGSKNGSAKLTEADIPKIFEMHRNGMYQREIAKFFGVSQPLIGMIIRREKWRHVVVTPL